MKNWIRNLLRSWLGFETHNEADWLRSLKGDVEVKRIKPAAKIIESQGGYDPETEVYGDLINPASTPLTEAWEKIEKGEAEIAEAWLFHGRFDKDGRLLRESSDGKPAYRIVRVKGHEAFRAKLKESQDAFDKLPERIRLAEARREARKRLGIKEDDGVFTSNTDAGSLMSADPNQFTEYTPMFAGPWGKQQYYDYFKGHARAFEMWNHNPIAKRIINILAQYALGRGFKVRVADENLQDRWDAHQKKTNLYHKIRKFWVREYLIYGELMVDLLKWVSIDPSTIWDIITEDEFNGNSSEVLYYQQMFQTITQTYAGQKVPGVPGSQKSTVGKYVIRQLPYDRMLHIRTECVSNEKRGRSILLSILGYCKRLKDLLDAQVLGEQIRSNFIYDDLIKGSDADVSAHAGRYNYMPPAGSVFAHNEAIERKPMAPMSGVSPAREGVAQEILAIIAAGMGLPKEHLNVLVTSGGNRATAVVGSEPFTKVIEDLQQDFEDLMYKLFEVFCNQNNIKYKPEDWSVIFPSVTKDSTGDSLKNIATAESMGWINKRRAATMAAAELEATNYNFEDEQAQGKQDDDKLMPADGMPSVTPPAQPPAGRFGRPPAQQQPPDNDNPIHGKGKLDIIAAHKSL